MLLIDDPRAGRALPGGQEHGETFEACARREPREEAGVDCAFTGVWSAQRRRFVHRDDPERRGYLLQVPFAAPHTGGEPRVREGRLDDGTVLGVRWFEEPPADAADFVTDPAARLRA